MQRYLEDQANIIEEALAAHALPGRVAGGTLSPRLIHFQLELPAGLRLARLTPALPTLAAGLGVEAVRLAPDAETGRPTLEVPRPDPVTVRLLPLARSVAEFAPPCTATLGQDVTGAPLLLRLDAPEVAPVLVCGDREAGKSALLRSMALSLALHNGPDTLRLLLVDLSGPARRGSRSGTWADLGDLPHLVGEVVRDQHEARLRLRWVARLAAARTELAAEGEPIAGANLVVLLDGLDAVLAGRDGAHLATTLQEIGTAGDCGVHLVAAAGDPGAGDLLTWGARIVGRVPDAATAAGAAGVRGTGAEGLLGRGDFLALLGRDVIRFQGGFVAPAEAGRTVALLRECAGERPGLAGRHAALPGALSAPSDEPATRRGLWKAHRRPVRLLKSGS